MTKPDVSRKARSRPYVRKDKEESMRRVREVYERAVVNGLPGNGKQFWRWHIFFWLDYHMFEELETKVKFA